MFGIRKISNILSSLNATLAKANQTIDGSTAAATKTTEHVKSDTSGIMTAKGVKDYVVAYQCNDYICLTISGLRTYTDMTNLIFGNMLGLKRFTPISTYLSVDCKSFVHMCHTGNLTFSCNDLLD